MIMDATKGFSHYTPPLAQNRPNAKGVRRKGGGKARKLAQNRRNHPFVMSKTSASQKTVYLFSISSLRDDKTPPKEPPPLRHNRPVAKGIRRKGRSKARSPAQNRRNHTLVMS